MSPRLDALPPCTACGGKVFPLVLCETCGAATILRDAEKLDWAVACPDCGTFTPWQMICDQCHSRFPAPGAVAEPSPPAPSPSLGPEAASAPGKRPLRRLRGEVDTRALIDMMQVVGLDPSRAQALIDRGYDAIWKIARAKEGELARIPEVGPVAARKVVASLDLLNYAPPPRTKESIAQDEYECPLCRCVTSAFASTCYECGAAFDEEEMDEAIRGEFSEDPDANILAFYDSRLAEKPDDADVLYALGLLLESLGRIDEAVEVLDRAAADAPGAKKIRVAQLRVQSKQPRKHGAAAKLRSTASALLDDAAWDEEVKQLDQLISSATPVCPECGTTVPKDAVLCPWCGVRLPTAPKPLLPEAPEPAPEPVKPVASPELDALVDDLLVGELEESLSEEDLELTKAAVLDWLIEELEDSMAPDLQVARPSEKRGEKEPVPATSPLTDSVGFLSGWMRGSRGLVSGVRPKRPSRGAGKVNGLVNGRGRVNGLVNGLGRTNGLVPPEGRVNGLVQSAGRVNGLVTPRGRVNGLVTGQGRINGIVNGTQFARGRVKGVLMPSPSRRIRYVAIASSTLVAALIIGVLFVQVPGPSAPIAIDGSFQDWAAVAMYDAATLASVANVSIAKYAQLLDRDSLYLFASTRGGTFGDAVGYDGMYFLVDADGNASTGFSFDGIGADTVVDAFGANHQLDGARLYSFPIGSEANWSQRQSVGSVLAAASSGGIEVKVSTYDIDRFDPSKFRISVYSDDFQGSSSRSKAPLNPSPGAVLLETRRLSLVVGSGSASLFEIHIRGLGMPSTGAWTVANLTLSATSGVSVFLSPESVSLTRGQPDPIITASAAAPGLFPGDAVLVNVTGANAPVPVFVREGEVRAYVIGPPTAVRIDGLFADWAGKDQIDTDPAPVNNSNVDIARYGASVDASTAYFHVAVAGEVFAGQVPERLVRSLPGPGGNGSGGGRPVPLPRQTGEDLLRVYIDLNASDSNGAVVDGIYADYLFELRGHGGRVTARTLFGWSGSWTKVPLPAVAVAKDATDFEGSIAVGPTTNRTRMLFSSTDWSGIGDITPPVNATVQAPAPVVQMSPPIINAPEFHEVILPVACTLLIVLGFARRRRRVA